MRSAARSWSSFQTALEQCLLDPPGPRAPVRLPAQPPERVQRQRIGDVDPDILDVVGVTPPGAPRRRPRHRVLLPCVSRDACRRRRSAEVYFDGATLGRRP
jgi:hypothetical protein